MSEKFGVDFSPKMAIASFDGESWTEPVIQAVQNLSLHPGSHVLHYSSEVFEGLKAYGRTDGTARIFRLDRHAARMARSAKLLHLPCPSGETFQRVVLDLVAANRDSIPPPPGTLYIRPALIGTDHNVGAAAAPSREALFFILTSPVGDYFASKGADAALRIVIDDAMRAVPGFGSAKTGGNYAAALGPVLRARESYQADQVLFCPGGDVQETAASNFLLLDDEEVVTRPLDDDAILHGVTRDSVLTLAESLGYRITQRNFRVDEILDWIARGGEAALSGTAAVLAGVGTFVHRGEEYFAGGEGGAVGPNTRRLREALTAIQTGEAEDTFGWLTEV